MSSLLLGCGLPGGMMGSMMADLAGIHSAINNILKKKGEKEYTSDEMLVKLFNEVEYVWPRVGYPPLVTPFSQYVKNIALMNLLTMAQGKGRFAMMDDSMWGMILGKSGKIPGEIDPELVKMAAEQGREFTDADPHTLLKNALPDFINEMEENGWDRGQDDEELYELAMHPEQYRNYKSGKAKENFEADCKKIREAKAQQSGGGHAYYALGAVENGQIFFEVATECVLHDCIEPLVGTSYEVGQSFCYILTAWGEMCPVQIPFAGKLDEVCVKQGQKVTRGMKLATLMKN